MQNRKWLIAGIVILVGIGASGVALYQWALGDTLAASGPVEAPTLALPSTADTTQPAATDLSTNTTPASQASASLAPESGLTIYQISQESSQVHFQLSEVLRGSPKEVIGTSNQVAGQVALNPSDLSTAQVGEIKIDARTLETDDAQRNRAIRNFILSTDQYEFITFTPTRIDGLEGSGNPGTSYTFNISGDLTIRDVTKPVTFDVTVQAAEDGKITGTATGLVNRSDFNLIIPNVPFVADVSEQVTLSIDFSLVSQ